MALVLGLSLSLFQVPTSESREIQRGDTQLVKHKTTLDSRRAGKKRSHMRARKIHHRAKRKMIRHKRFAKRHKRIRKARHHKRLRLAKRHRHFHRKRVRRVWPTRHRVHVIKRHNCHPSRYRSHIRKGRTTGLRHRHVHVVCVKRKIRRIDARIAWRQHRAKWLSRMRAGRTYRSR